MSGLTMSQTRSLYAGFPGTYQNNGVNRRSLVRASSGVVPPMYGRVGGRPGGGLGYAQVIAAVLGPLVEGGVGSYAVYAQAKQAKSQAKQRERELDVQRKLAEMQLAAQERSYGIAQQAAIQQAQIAQVRAAKAAPYVVGIVGLGVAGLVLAAVVRGRR